MNERNILNLSMSFDRIKKKACKKCPWIHYFMKQYPTINTQVIATALLEGINIYELEIIAEEIKGLTFQQQKRVVLEKGLF